MLPTAHAVHSPIELMVAAMRAVYTSRVQRARAEARNIRAIFVLSTQRHWRVWQNSHSDLPAQLRWGGRRSVHLAQQGGVLPAQKAAGGAEAHQAALDF